MVLLKRKLIVVATCIVIALLGTLIRANAQQQIVVKMDFEFLRQGTAGLVLLTGPDVVGAVASTMDRTFPFFPTSAGYACLLAAPMEQRIKDYPMTITITRRDGSTVNWDGILKVASGQFIAETPFSLPSDKLYLLSDEVQSSEDKKLNDTYNLVTPVRFWEGAFTMPANGPLSSPYGTVRSYNGVVSRRHTGYDIRAQSGTPVLASASGRVVLSRPLDIHGNNIVIDHGWGIYSEYAHLSERYVVPGQFVLQGDLIGLSGSTGRSTGPHIHWEIAVNGVVVNPIAFMQVKLPN
ncbi:MAG: M23 family metallopeptidase [Anaerolineae bacterium]|nr:M23 family metallopeptidase [Anaerolineae bacterium]